MKHFTLNECLRSDTAHKNGFDNTPTETHLANIHATIEQCFDPMREAWAIHCAQNGLGTPAIRLSSFYRGFRLNKAAGGSSTSAHCTGNAGDCVPLNGRLAEFKSFCRAHFKGRAFDQLISESEDTKGVPVWIHIGFKNNQGRQRKQMLSKVGEDYIHMT